MNGNNRLKAFAEPLSAFWIERNARERNALALAALAILLALVYLLLIAPALAGRAQLEKSLPALRQQAAELQALSKQAVALDNNAAPPAATVTKESIEASLARKGLKPQSVVLTGELVKVQLATASFAGIVAWLDEMQKTARLSLAEGNIETLAAIDTVNATLTLRQQKSDKTDG
ncbi:MAG TPA: type II secretion system protein GspM [Paucimonas sp.]|nr:type II secretion system protein GspM [Paucimonas sp.]HJW54002.1 type II secretion system protein GspM [Burkholderiaceae bacterium]